MIIYELFDDEQTRVGESRADAIAAYHDSKQRQQYPMLLKMEVPVNKDTVVRLLKGDGGYAARVWEYDGKGWKEQ